MTSKEFLLLKTELQFIQKQNEIIIKDFSKKLESLQNDVEKLQKQNQNLKEKLEQVSERRSEQYYQRYLEKLLSATHQKTKHGITDITTDTQIIEIKHWRNYKSALGQLLSYKDSEMNKNKNLIVYFFGVYEKSLKETVVQLFQQKEISIYEFIDTEDGIKVKELYKKDKIDLNESDPISQFINERCNINKYDKSLRVFCKNLWQSFQEWSCNSYNIKQLEFYKRIDDLSGYNRKNKVIINDERSTGWYGINIKTNIYELYEWVDNNIQYNKGSHVALKDICQMFFEDNLNVGVKEKGKLRENLEKIFNSNCLRTTLNGNPFQGWFDLELKRNSFENWLDQNVEYKKDSVLKLTDLCELYLNKKDIHSTESSKYKVDIEAWIKNQFPNIKNEYGIFKISGDQTVYRGWKHLQIKPNLVEYLCEN